MENQQKLDSYGASPICAIILPMVPFVHSEGECDFFEKKCDDGSCVEKLYGTCRKFSNNK